jgi:hypothetical protein
MATQTVTIQLGLRCPVCPEVVNVPVKISIIDGTTLEFDPDVADLWVHAWTHTDPPPPEKSTP